VVDLVSPIVAAKAIKNAAELEGMRQAHLRDAVAICDFLNWLENKVREYTEVVMRGMSKLVY
jgi:Xaa-Pro aminopeptidase